MKMKELLQVLVTTTGCLCLFILVVGTMVGIGTGLIGPELIGTSKGVGIGGGLVGLSSIIFLVIRIGITGGTSGPQT